MMYKIGQEGDRKLIMVSIPTPYYPRTPKMPLEL